MQMAVSITAPVFGKLVGIRTIKDIANGQIVDPYLTKPAVATTPMARARVTRKASPPDK